jgi:hypothetical protein
MRNFPAICSDAVHFSQDSRLVVLSSNSGNGGVYDISNGRLLRSVFGRGLHFTPNRRIVAVGFVGNSCNLIDLATGSTVLSIVRLEPDDEWLAVTPEGLFDGTEKARQRLAFRIGGGLNIVPVDRFFQDYYRPGLVAEVLRGERPMPKGEFANQVAPLVAVVSPKQGSAITERQATIEVEVTDRGGGIKGPWLMQNGARVLADGEANVDGKLARHTFRVALIEGENRIEVCAASADGSWEAEPAVLVLRGELPLPKPAVHVVAVGVNKYAQESINLQYAAGDAEAIANVFQDRGPEFYGEKQVRTTLLLNEAATTVGIRRAIEDVAAAANVQDTMVLFLAGHGMTLGQRYYFLPHEFQSKADRLEDDVREQGLTIDSMGDLMEKVPALKKVVILDTCQSGAALPVRLVARDPFAFRGAIERLSRSQGLFMIAAAAAGDQAQESQELKHGVLTYALLAGLGAVDSGPLAKQLAKASDDSRLVEIRDWFGYAQDKVPLITRLYFNQEQFICFRGEGESFPVLPLAD